MCYLSAIRGYGGGGRVALCDALSAQSTWASKPSTGKPVQGRGPCGSEQVSGMIIDGSGQEGAICGGRPAHDHWMNSPSSGQHTAHYSPVIIATFVDQFIALARWRPCAFFLDGSGAASLCHLGQRFHSLTAARTGAH